MTSAYSRAEAIDDDLADYLALPGSASLDYVTCTTQDVRDQFAANRKPTAVPAVHSITNSVFPGPGGDVAVQIYRMTHTPSPAILWFHGGGWVLGDLDTGELPAQTLCHLSGCTVISVDYRLAPETPFPGAFDDCAASLHWASDHSAELMIDPARIIVGGDSSGGNLAAAVALSARNGGTELAGQLLIYPVVQSGFTLPSFGEVGEGYGLVTGAMEWFWDKYVPNPAGRTDPRVAPLGQDLSGTAPAFVLTCGFDPLASEGLLYGDALRDHGVPVTAVHQPSGIHGNFAMPKRSGIEGRKAAAVWVKQRVS